MDSLQDWVRTLALTLVLAGMADMLVPESGLRRQARLGIGLVVLAVLLAPLLRLHPATLAREFENAWRVARPSPGTSAPGPPAPFAPAFPVPAAPGAGGAYEAAPSETPPDDTTLSVYVAMLEQRLGVLAESVPGVAGASVRATLDRGPWGRWGRLAALDVSVSAAAPPSERATARAPSGANGPAALVERIRAVLAQETGVRAGSIRVRLAESSR